LPSSGGVFGTPSDPEAEEVMHFDGHKKAWKLDLTEENIDKLKEMAMPSREKKDARNND